MLHRQNFAETLRRRAALPVVTLAVVAGIGLGVAGTALIRGGSSAIDMPDRVPELPEGIVALPEQAQKNAGVQAARVAVRRLPVTLDATGVVGPDEGRLAHIRPLARGVVEQIHVALGTRVAAGRPLVTYDNIELGQLIGDYLSERAALGQSETDRDVKRRAVERAEGLITIEAIAQQELDLRRAEFKNAEAAVASARARVAKIEEQLHRFGLTDRDLASLTPEENRTGHRVKSHTVLRAPFAGVVTKYDVAAGEVVEPEKELFTLTDLSSVWVLADVYEKDLARIQPGTIAEIRTDAYPDRTFAGRLAHVSDLIEPSTRTARVRCVVPNADGALKLDMFVKVKLTSREQRDALVVPGAAVQQVDGRPVVFVRRSATTFERRDVQLGVAAGELIEVRGGLQAGEVVVGDGSFYLKTALLRERIGEEH